jgi:hypothetical protein
MVSLRLWDEIPLKSLKIVIVYDMYIQFAKFNSRPYHLETNSPNVMLIEDSHYTEYARTNTHTSHLLGTTSSSCLSTELSE